MSLHLNELFFQVVTLFLLELVIEISDKTKKKSPLFPLENQKGFQLLYNGVGKQNKHLASSTTNRTGNRTSLTRSRGQKKKNDKKRRVMRWLQRTGQSASQSAFGVNESDITGTNQIVPRSAMNLENLIRSCAVQWSSIRIVFYKIVLICNQVGKPIACFRKKKRFTLE